MGDKHTLPIQLIRGGGGGRVLRWLLGGYVPPRSPNLDPVLERMSIQNDGLWVDRDDNRRTGQIFSGG